MQLSRRVRGPFFHDEVACQSRKTKATKTHVILKVMYGKLAVCKCSATIISFDKDTLYKACHQHIQNASGQSMLLLESQALNYNKELKGGLISVCESFIESNSIPSNHQLSPQAKLPTVPKTKKNEQGKFVCSHCPMVFSRLYMLTRHKEVVQHIGLSESNFVYRNKKGLKSKNSKHFECSQCERVYLLQNIPNHHAIHHPKKTDITYVEITQRRYKKYAQARKKSSYYR
jgi:hypothetical protein